MEWDCLKVQFLLMSPEGNIGLDLAPGDAELIRSGDSSGGEMFTCSSDSYLVLPKYPSGSFWLDGCSDFLLSWDGRREIQESAAIPSFGKPQQRARRDFPNGGKLKEEQAGVWGNSWRK